ncbi:MAG: M23 family metallopeptidase [Clostridia bacterium]|nr:M23 family metallopeptidase [Clostridia bacterium]
MRKKLRRVFDAWGHYLLALLCAGVILLSAAWTREQQRDEITDQQALSDQSQRLAQVTPLPTMEACGWPADGALVRGYCETPVFFPAFNLWQAHPAVDVQAEEGNPVYAMLAGTVESCNRGEVRIDHGNGLKSRYRGLKKISVMPGQQVRKGAVIGSAGGHVPYEGDGHICVALLKDGRAIPFEFAEREKNGLPK